MKTLWPQSVSFQTYCFSLIGVEIGARFNLRGFLIDLLDVFKRQTYIHCPSVNRAIIKSLSGYWTGIYTTADTGNFLP